MLIGFPCIPTKHSRNNFWTRRDAPEPANAPSLLPFTMAATESSSFVDRVQDFVSEHKKAIIFTAAAAVAVGGVAYYHASTSRPRADGKDKDVEKGEKKKKHKKKKAAKDNGPILEEKKAAVEEDAGAEHSANNSEDLSNFQ